MTIPFICAIWGALGRCYRSCKSLYTLMSHSSAKMLSWGDCECGRGGSVRGRRTSSDQCRMVRNRRFKLPLLREGVLTDITSIQYSNRRHRCHATPPPPEKGVHSRMTREHEGIQTRGRGAEPHYITQQPSPDPSRSFGGFPREFNDALSAPASRSNENSDACPRRPAVCSGVLPCSSRAVSEARAVSSRRAVAQSPWSAQWCSGACERVSALCTSALSSKRRSTWGRWQVVSTPVRSREQVVSKSSR